VPPLSSRLRQTRPRSEPGKLAEQALARGLDPLGLSQAALVELANGAQDVARVAERRGHMALKGGGMSLPACRGLGYAAAAQALTRFGRRMERSPELR